MKKFSKMIVAVFAITLAFIIGSCSTSMANAEQNNPVKIWLHNCNGLETIYMIVDEETGVNYIGYSSGDMRGGCAITPRLNADGTLYVSK